MYLYKGLAVSSQAERKFYVSLHLVYQTFISIIQNNTFLHTTSLESYSSKCCQPSFTIAKLRDRQQRLQLLVLFEQYHPHLPCQRLLLSFGPATPHPSSNDFSLRHPTTSFVTSSLSKRHRTSKQPDQHGHTRATPTKKWWPLSLPTENQRLWATGRHGKLFVLPDIVWIRQQAWTGIRSRTKRSQLQLLQLRSHSPRHNG